MTAKNYTERKKLRAIESYLAWNITEYVNCKNEIFKSMDLNNANETTAEKIMQYLTRYVSIYYLNIIEGKFPLEHLKKFMRKEISVALIILTKNYEYNFDAENSKKETVKKYKKRVQDLIKKHVEYLFRSIYPVFVQFKSQEELLKIIETALEFAMYKEISLGMIAPNTENYHELMRKIYENPQKFKKNLESALSSFSVKAMIERLVIQEENLADSAELAEKMLDEQRKKISESPEIQARMEKIQIALETYINKRTEEIFPP
ncbi:MAG: hypothetical protein AAB674_03095 [Patescibacteria group bacterium]